jgi:hypothetical protein
MMTVRPQFKPICHIDTPSGVENKDLHWEAKISSRHASILKQFAIALELFNKKSLEYRLLVWLCEQLQAAHLSGIVWG